MKNKTANLYFWRRASLLLGFVLICLAGAAPVPYANAESPTTDSDRYFIRVDDCDDGGRAYLNGTMVVDVGFNEDSNWLDITKDLTKKKNEVKFQVINKTGAITYRFQVRRNNEVVYDQACGTVAVVGCEENRAFRIGAAREFIFKIEK